MVLTAVKFREYFGEPHFGYFALHHRWDLDSMEEWRINLPILCWNCLEAQFFAHLIVGILWVQKWRGGGALPGVSRRLLVKDARCVWRPVDGGTFAKIHLVAAAVTVAFKLQVPVVDSPAASVSCAGLFGILDIGKSDCTAVVVQDSVVPTVTIDSCERRVSSWGFRSRKIALDMHTKYIS